jgi:hypothetical protein
MIAAESGVPVGDTSWFIGQLIVAFTSSKEATDDR